MPSDAIPLSPPNGPAASALRRDLTAGLVVFLVALPLCLGIALASNAPPVAGLLAGIVGGLLVGLLSGSHTSVAGPAAGLTAVVAAQIAALGSFETFLLAVFLAGLIQVGLGLARAGFLSAFFPSSVIKGLLAAIGVILILKQIPHVLGHDDDPEGEMSFFQPDQRNTFTEILDIFSGIEPGAALIGVLSVALLVVWDRVKALKKSVVPAPLLVVVLGVVLAEWFKRLGEPWFIDTSHLVQVPIADTFAGLFGLLRFPDFTQLGNTKVYFAALTIAAVASLETLLNLEAVDKIDPQQRTSPASRELFAQGVGNAVAGLIGGLPVTSVIVRSSVNINAGAQTKLSAIVHGALLAGCVALLPAWLNLIPLSCLAAILLVTGVKLASPALVRQMWEGGRPQFLPFVITVVAIVFTDLLIGVLIGLGAAVAFILRSNLRRPMHRIIEKHLGGEVVHVELANQVSFLNRAALARVLDEVPPGGHVLLDAQGTDYIDPDILSMIRDYKEDTAPARGIAVSVIGFRSRYQLADETQYVDYSTRELQSKVTPEQVLQILKDGHERFRTGHRLTRDLGRLVNATADGQHPLAVVLSCIDSRAPAELIFDVGVGDIFSVRLAGNILSRKALGSMEYAVAVAGAKLIVIMGHTRCGAVGAAVNFLHAPQSAAEATGCAHLEHVVRDIEPSIDADACRGIEGMAPAARDALVNGVARRNVLRGVELTLQQSPVIRGLVAAGRVGIVGAMYDVASGGIEFFNGGPPG